MKDLIMLIFEITFCRVIFAAENFADFLDLDHEREACLKFIISSIHKILKIQQGTLKIVH